MPRASRLAGATRRKAAPSRLAGATSAAIALPLTPPFRWKRSPKPKVGREQSAKAPLARARPHDGVGRRVAAVAVALPDHPWLDRVVRGRAWIPLLGVLLAGIVAAQVEILKLGANLGRALEQTSTLTTQNEQLRGNVAGLSDEDRIERLAGARGLVLPPPGAVGYLAAKPGGNVSRALANIHRPDSAAFVALTPHNGALVTGPGTSTLPPPLGAPPPPTTTTTTTSTATTTSAATTTQSATTPAATAVWATTPQATTAPQTTTEPQPTTAPTTSAPPASTPTSASAQATTTPTQSSAASTTGAAAIQPSATSQPSGGG